MSEWIVSADRIENFARLKEAGADAVLIGTDFYSARAMACIALSDYPKAKQEAQRLSLKLYVLMNRMFAETELDAMRTHLHLLKELDVDGIYYGDEGVLWESMRLGMQDKLIYHPDTLLTNSYDVNYYLQEGIQRVVLAKEITFEEIKHIAHNTIPSRIEMLVHGRVNLIHSKRWLLSAYMEHLGKPCDLHARKDLAIIETKREEAMPILEDDLGTHVFSGYTLASFEELDELLEVGYTHFRIDGIFYDIDWVCEALRLYRSIEAKESKGREVFRSYAQTHLEAHVGSGFYYKKTGLHKG